VYAPLEPFFIRVPFGELFSPTVMPETAVWRSKAMEMLKDLTGVTAQ